MSSQAFMSNQQDMTVSPSSVTSMSAANTTSTADTSSTQQYWRWWHTISILLFSAGIATIGPLLPPTQRLLIWLGYLALLFAFILIIGNGITGKWSGALIDDRNKISLSRLQSVLWTVLVLSAFLTAALTNINFVGAIAGLQIALPQQLWILMGISLSSLIGTPLIHNYKKDKDLPPDQQVDNDRVESKGLMMVNKNKNFAQWRDLFCGEDVGNRNNLDLGKVQMFCFTLLLVFAYAVALGALFNSPTHAITVFPALDDSVIALLGISHIGYLANKAVPHTN